MIYFASPFYGGQQITVLASVGHTTKSQTPRNGAAVWVEAVTASKFTVCILEFGNGSNKTSEVNWLSFQASLRGSQVGTTSLKFLDNWDGMQEDRFSAGKHCMFDLILADYYFSTKEFIT